MCEPLDPAAFAPFGEVIAERAEPSVMINRGRCARHHDLATLQSLGAGARPVVSLFVSRGVSLPYTFDLMERHPLGSQAFMPLEPAPFLVIVAPDRSGVPGQPRAFLPARGQGVNLFAGVWHGVLAPLIDSARFLVIDRAGPGTNLEEHRLAQPYSVRAARAT